MNKLKKFIVADLVAVVLIASALVAVTYQSYDNGDRERGILTTLLGDGYRVVLPRDYFAGDNLGKIVLLLHDIDFSFRGLDKFVWVEAEFNVRSCFLPRFVMAANSSGGLAKLETVLREGFEVGFQYETLSEAKGNLEVAYYNFGAQWVWFREKFNVSTTDYHGDFKSPILNLDLYNASIWRSLGLHEIYKLSNYSYYTDTDNHLATPVLPLKDLVIVQLHTDWTS